MDCFVSLWTRSFTVSFYAACVLLIFWFTRQKQENRNWAQPFLKTLVASRFVSSCSLTWSINLIRIRSILHCDHWESSIQLILVLFAPHHLLHSHTKIMFILHLSATLYWPRPKLPTAIKFAMTLMFHTQLPSIGLLMKMILVLLSTQDELVVVPHFDWVMNKNMIWLSGLNMKTSHWSPEWRLWMWWSVHASMVRLVLRHPTNGWNILLKDTISHFVIMVVIWNPRFFLHLSFDRKFKAVGRPNENIDQNIRAMNYGIWMKVRSKWKCIPKLLLCSRLHVLYIPVQLFVLVQVATKKRVSLLHRLSVPQVKRLDSLSCSVERTS